MNSKSLEEAATSPKVFKITPAPYSNMSDEIIKISASPTFVGVLLKIYDEYPVDPSISFDGVNEASDLHNRLTLTGKWLSFKGGVEAEKTAIDFVTFSEGKSEIHYDEISDFVTRYYAILTVHGVPWVFDKRYHENKEEIEKLVDSILRDAGITDKSRISGVINEVIDRITRRTTVRNDEFNIAIKGHRIIPVSNGVILLSEQCIVPNSPAWGLTYSINAKFDPDVDTSAMEHYMAGLVHEDDLWKLQQIGACCLIREAYKKAYFVYNKIGNNGKTTFLNVLTEFLGGNDNVSALTLQQIAGDRFKGAELYGKIANIAPEIPVAEISDPAYFKAVTGNDNITAERKYKDPFSFQNKAVLVFGANTLPEINCATPSVMKRIVMIEFPNVFDIDEKFIEKMTTEEMRSALLNIFLAHLVKEVLPHGARGSESDFERTAEIYKYESNSVFRFYRNYLERSDIDSILPFEDVYQSYSEVQKRENDTLESKNKFKKTMREEGIRIFFRGKRGEQVEYIAGVAWKEQPKLESWV